VLSMNRHIPALRIAKTRKTGNRPVEMMEYARFALALIFVLGLIAGCSWLGKRLGLAPRTTTGGSAKRLNVVAIQSVDSRRKLVLIRRDNIEHLILLNGERDLLIESGIESREEIETPAQPAGNGLPGLARILQFGGKLPNV